MSDNAILQIALVILALPMLSFALIFFFGKKMPRQGDWLAVGLMGIAQVLLRNCFIGMTGFIYPGRVVMCKNNCGSIMC